MDAGRQCLDALRRDNVGRAVLICLDQLKVGDMSPISTPENVPRLFDLIKPTDERFSAAFYHGVRNTLVAKDLDQANRIAYGKQRYRVVTLKGELIETSGTMSGGGSRPLKGGMSSKTVQEFSSEDVAKLRTELEKDLKKLDELESDFNTVKEELESIQSTLPKLNVDVQKIELDVKSLQKQIPLMQTRVTELT